MIHDWNSVVEKYTQTMLQLLYLVCVWETWRTKADREYSSFTDCGRDRRVKNPVPQIVKEIAEVSKSSIVWRSIPNLYFVEIKVFPG